MATRQLSASTVLRRLPRILTLTKLTWDDTLDDLDRRIKDICYNDLIHRVGPPKGVIPTYRRLLDLTGEDYEWASRLRTIRDELLEQVIGAEGLNLGDTNDGA